MNVRVLTQPVERWVCSSCQLHRHARRAFYALASHSRVSRKDHRPRNRQRLLTKTYATSPEHLPTRRGEKLPEFPARTRFAPSPTGYMHIGGLRTALFSYLLAKRTQGQFLLRVEDTDQKRLVPDAEQRLCEDLQWAGLYWDEGPQIGGSNGPYRQSQRTEIYQEHAKQLLRSESAYRCFCTAQTTGAEGGKAAYVTSGCYQDCSSLSLEEAQDRADSKQEAFTVRLKQPADVHKRVYTDLIYGKIQRLKRSPSASQGGDDDVGIDAADTILVKSDGTPTYHFANVVDDHLMKITHVIRGTEWMASTPLHYDLYSAFGWDPPAFAHVGLLVDENRAKLSKRSHTGLVLDVKGMREEQRILPEALINFLTLLGWSNPGRNDVLEMDELIRDFDLKFTKGNTIVRTEKLWYLQKQHVARRCERSLQENTTKPISDLIREIRKEAETAYPEALKSRFAAESDIDQYCAAILHADSKSYQTPKQYLERNNYFFHFDASRLPAHSDSFSDGASAKAFQTLTRKILEEFDFKQPYRQPTTSTKQVSPSESATSPPNAMSEVNSKSTLIHAAINHSIWRALANPMWLMLPRDQYLQAALAKQVPAPGEELVYVPFTDQALDLEAFAKVLGDKGSNPQISLAGIDETVKAYKEWNKGMMKYLRERLSYGQPGPGVGVIMAILGYEECCRRLEVVAQKNDGGW